jgi:hypothetical protein
MRLGARVSEDYMVAVFLRGELESPRWRQHVTLMLASLRFPLSLVAQPNLDDACENTYRAWVLRYRGYTHNTGLFTGFPDDVVWRLATLNASDLPGIMDMIDAHYPDDDFDPRGAPEVIVVGDGLDNLVILEGHARVAAASRRGCSLPALVGLSPKMSEWKYY